MAILKKYEKGKSTIYKWVVRVVKVILILTLITIICSAVAYCNKLLLTLIFICIFTYLFYLYLKIGCIKSINSMRRIADRTDTSNKKTLVIVAHDNIDTIWRIFFPSVEEKCISSLMAYLDLRWGENNYNILYTKKQLEIIKRMQDEKVRNVYFFGHGNRKYFDNFGATFDYELLSLIDNKKDMVVQLTCCNGKGLGCAADYLLEGKNREKWQAGTVINIIDKDVEEFYRKDLAENIEGWDGKDAKKKFREAARRKREELKDIFD